jgi:polyphosphate kinase
MSDETMAITLPEPSDLPSDRFLDRELSWLAFNQRVLELAEDPNLYLLERVNFLSIFSSNLDEFFMVRVAGLKRRIATGLATVAASGKSPEEVLESIRETAHALQTRQAVLFRDEVEPALNKHGISVVHWSDLTDAEQTSLNEYFKNQIFPVLTPLGVDPAHPFPYISGLSLNIAVVFKKLEDGTQQFARVKVPPLLPRFVRIPGESGTGKYRFLPVETLIGKNLAELFPGTEVLRYNLFRVTRNEDLEVDEDEGENLLVALERELLRRRFGPPVRLEVADDMDHEVLDLLVRELDISEDDVYRLPALLDLTALAQLAGIKKPELKYPPHPVVTNRFLVPAEDEKPNIFRAIRERDILLHHPYESFATSVQAFLEQAAADPKVLAIKQTLYRTSGDSPIVDALISAAEAGKQVLALVEIKARFDEQNNITWARKLEQAGVHVVYGIVGLKTHCKLSLVIRQEVGELRRYCHIGTGNYNPKTARFYEDLGLLTARESVGDDLIRLFNRLSGYAPDATFNSILVSPGSVRQGLIERIEREIEHHGAGREALIRIKVNSIVDEQIIDALYRAGQAGVPVEILVRGMCAVRPGVPGLSESIKVRSVLGRYLEHSRVFAFAGGGTPEFFIGSADMMHRNLDRRVEALVRITSPEHQKDLSELFDLAMSDDASAWHLHSTGEWTRHKTAKDVQDAIMADIASRKAVR